MTDDKPTMQTLVSQYADLHKDLREEDSYAFLWLLLQDGSVMSALKKRILIDHVLASIGRHTPDKLQPVLDFIEQLELHAIATATPAYWHLMTTRRLVSVHCLIGRDRADFIPEFIRQLIPTGVRLVKSRQDAAKAWMDEIWTATGQGGDVIDKRVTRWITEALAVDTDEDATDDEVIKRDGPALNSLLNGSPTLRTLFQQVTDKRQRLDSLLPIFDDDGNLTAGDPQLWIAEQSAYISLTAKLHEYLMLIAGYEVDWQPFINDINDGLHDLVDPDDTQDDVERKLADAQGQVDMALDAMQCPECRSRNTSGEGLTADGNNVIQLTMDMHCLACGHEWVQLRLYTMHAFWTMDSDDDDEEGDEDTVIDDPLMTAFDAWFDKMTGNDDDEEDGDVFGDWPLQ